MRVMVEAGVAKESGCGRLNNCLGRHAAESAAKREPRMGRDSPVKLLETLAVLESGLDAVEIRRPPTP